MNDKNHPQRIRRHIKKSYLILCLASSLVACGGSDSSSRDDTTKATDMTPSIEKNASPERDNSYQSTLIMTADDEKTSVSSRTATDAELLNHDYAYFVVRRAGQENIHQLSFVPKKNETELASIQVDYDRTAKRLLRLQLYTSDSNAQSVRAYSCDECRDIRLEYDDKTGTAKLAFSDQTMTSEFAVVNGKKQATKAELALNGTLQGTMKNDLLPMTVSVLDLGEVVVGDTSHQVLSSVRTHRVYQNTDGGTLGEVEQVAARLANDEYVFINQKIRQNSQTTANAVVGAGLLLINELGLYQYPNLDTVTQNQSSDKTKLLSMTLSDSVLRNVTLNPEKIKVSGEIKLLGKKSTISLGEKVLFDEKLMSVSHGMVNNSRVDVLGQIRQSDDGRSISTVKVSVFSDDTKGLSKVVVNDGSRTYQCGGDIRLACAGVTIDQKTNAITFNDVSVQDIDDTATVLALSGSLNYLQGVDITQPQTIVVTNPGQVPVTSGGGAVDNCFGNLKFC